MGEGAFGQVFLFKSKTNQKSEFAVKIMLKEHLTPQILSLVREEVAILSMLDHANIVKYVESYEDSRYMYIVMELLQDAVELQEVVEK